MTDLTPTIAPNSDQLNADDLIAGPRTIVITRVKAGSKEQPIAIHFEGDGGKPYLPCKSMRRVLVHVWGADGGAYVGKSLTLYRDPNVQFGGHPVGGIRISHMSHIDGPRTMPLTATRGSRKPFTVKPITTTTPKTSFGASSEAGVRSQPTAPASTLSFAGGEYDPAQPRALPCDSDFSDREVQQCAKTLRTLIERAPDPRAWFEANAQTLDKIKARSPKLEAWVRNMEPNTPSGGGVGGAPDDARAKGAPSSLEERA